MDKNILNFTDLFEQKNFKTLAEKIWHEEWKMMPEYNNVNEPDPEITLTFKFRNNKDYNEFKELVKKYCYDGQKAIDGQQQKHKKQAWYPLKEKSSQYLYVNNKNLNPRFPVYIVSKGRFVTNSTSKTLTEMNVPFYLICEKDEFQKYCKILDRKKLLILPQKYKKEYDTFWKDNDPRTGPGPARNFAWQHSIDNGYEWHWVLDDNIWSYERFNNNMKINCTDGTPFYVVEDFVLRYKNIGQAGFNYANFCHSNEITPPIILNTRIYSSLLIKNNLPFRWRGRYNEDTDLSLRILKSGLCTVQFNAFLQGKKGTQKQSGGNTKEFYEKEGTKKKSQMLADMHPDVAKVVWKFNRWHHHVNYKKFKNNKLLRKSNVFLKDEINNYGLIKIKKNMGIS